MDEGRELIMTGKIKRVRGISAINRLTVFEMSSMAECFAPDTRRSPGALLLKSVRDAVVEAIRDGRITEHDRDNSGQIHEIADNAPDVYTHRRWAEFLDLGAYQEDPEMGNWPDNMTEAAGVALYQIAERLANALVDAWIEARI